MLKTTLPNGLKVIVQENHAAKVAAIQVWVHVGSADERPDEAGLAHVHEHMLFKGTQRRGVGAIAAEVEAAGGDINAWTSYDQTVYHVTMASRDFDVGLDILADAVQHSAFDAGELERELEVVIEEIRRGNDTPGRVMSEKLFSTAYNTHPYSRPVIGYVESVRAFTREKILDFYKRWYRPKNMVLVVSGDVDTQAVLAKAGELFHADDAALPQRPRTPEPPQRGFRYARKDQDIQETHLGIAWQGVPFKHEDTAALDVLSVLLGSGDSSRLFRRVKREKELVNDCYAFAYTPEDPGLMMVGATIHGDGVEAAYEALLRETFRLRFANPSDAEIAKAKTILLSEAIYQKETVQGIARKMGYFEIVAGEPEYEDVYYAKVREVQPEDVRRVAEKYLRPEAQTVSVLLPTEFAAKLPETAARGIAERVLGELEHEYKPLHVELGAEQVARKKLSNGATLLVREDRSVPLVAIRAASKGGLIAESPANNGVSHLVGELLVRGTKRYSAEQIAEETDATASSISGQSGRNSLGMAGSFLLEFWHRGFELFASCLLEPAFEAAEIERERKTQIEDIASRQDSLSAVAFDQFAEALYKQHPYRLPMLGTKESVEGLGLAQIVDAFRTQLRPDHLTIAVVGAVDVAETIELIERRIGSVKAHADARGFVQPADEAMPTAPRSAEVLRNKEQAHVVLGFPGVSLFDERRWALEVLSTILAGQGGRLFLELRDKQSLAYSVTAMSMEGLAPGYFATYIGTAQDKLKTAEDGLIKELEKVLKSGVEAAELERAQRYLIGTHEVALQRAGARAGTMALHEAYGVGYEEYARYAKKVSSVTAKRVHEVAKDIIRFERMVRAVVRAEAPSPS